jgi:hypothetical protein
MVMPQQASLIIKAFKVLTRLQHEITIFRDTVCVYVLLELTLKKLVTRVVFAVRCIQLSKPICNIKRNKSYFKNIAVCVLATH